MEVEEELVPAHRRADRKRPLTAPRKGPAAPSPTNGPIPSAAGSKPPFLDRLPFRRKLNVLVIVPLAVVSAMLSFVILGQIDRARSAADTAQLVRDSAKVARLIDGVQSEHRQALLVSLRHEAAPSKDNDTSAYLQAQREVTDQVAAVRSAYGDRLPEDEAKALKELEGLDSLRQSVESGPLPASNIDPAYEAVITGLITGLDLGGEGADTATEAGSLLDALLRADTAHASFETSVFAARTRDPSALMEFTRAVRDYEQYTYQAERFTRLATQEQGVELAAMAHSPYQRVVADHYADLQVKPGDLVAENAAQLRAALEDALTAEQTYESQAQNRLKITQSLIGQIAGDAESASQRAWGQVVLLATGTVLAFAAWFLFSVLVRRSVVRTVRTLTEAAQDVADAAGTELARVADDDADDASPPRLTAVPVPVRDELGELAEAFNQVQLTATALLERQVIGRRNIATMFGNVGHRVSNLTTRQLALIDSVERGETDPETLERLYRIDHIAVRLQRNADSLMLLAGIRESGLGAEPMRLSNIVRAALGQIEGYQRVTPHAEGDVTIAPDIVSDLTLMLAELLENAVQFSPASSSVEVVLRPRPDDAGALVEIVDHGLGMSAERLAEENARLIRRERLDLAPTEVLGLFVVGGLSRRWRIEVTLSRTPGGGVTATVVVPPAHLVHGDPVGAPARTPRMLPPAR
ncbi:HAMP domain-containing protein, partial [Streptomyces sp. T-3]|nr:HAMP domain-containing protein [Streptomyces sp. T-3]